MSANLQNLSSLTDLTLRSACFQFVAGGYIFYSCVFTFILSVLPPSVFVLYLGIQRWWRRRSVSAAEAVSPSDFFTYNLAVIELLAVLSYVLYACTTGRFGVQPWTTGRYGVQLFVQYLGVFSWLGQTLTPILTCVERYLAVVHPVTYLGLKKVGGVRIRNISMGCVWLLSSGGAGLLLLLILRPEYGVLPGLPILILLLASMTFCSLSALRVLLRPRPGKASRDQVDRAKRRASQTILVIMGVLWLKLGWNVIAVSLRSSPSTAVRCLGESSVFVSSLPSSLLPPLLFLHRAGKLPNCKRPCDP